ncbi:AAA family ATPase [Parafrankia discariae]|uniref:AAA family ATPase n=1 Tax=Parafrankia discariae TaxID=365528 RepID=UPI00037763C1|nr:SMC family ATPase [Parafrankia discariae]
MRPVQLDLAGFGSFREPAVLDLADADYFALVGPTGAGKSTLIDALTFALFGSVPRWNNRATVHLALAPTAARGTVRLVFDVAGARYVVARELRRAARGGVSVRNARFERLVDPAGAGEPGEPTEVLAAGAPAVTAAVEELLGLTFEHFCTCVVLPQGEFAEFLRAKPSERQAILTRLLGLGVYDTIRAAANARASDQRQRADVFAEQLAGYADATAAAETAAADRVGALTRLAAEVAGALAELAGLDTAAAQAAAETARLAAERDRLAAVRPPAGLADLAGRLRAARAADTDARERRQEAERADSVAREQLAAAAPRGPLDRSARDHAELADLLATRPTAGTEQAAADTALAAAAAALEEARDGLATARAAERAAERAADLAAAETGRLGSELDLLAGVRAPGGLAALTGRLREAEAVRAAAVEYREAAERADTAVRAERAAAPPRGPLERALRDHERLAELSAGQAGAAAAHGEARAALDRANAALEAARHARQRAAGVRDEAARADLAAALRPHLVVGEDCLVCARPVATLPPALPAAGLGVADEAVAAAEHELAACTAQAHAATRAALESEAHLTDLDNRVEELRRGLTDAPDARHAAALLADVERLDGDVARADLALRRARDAAAAADAAVTRSRDEAAGARRALDAVRDPLVFLGAPALPDGDLEAAWATLVTWAAGLARDRAGQRDAAAGRSAAAAGSLAAARQALALASAGQARADEERIAAARAQQRAATRIATLDDRTEALRAALAGAPTAAAVAAALAELDRLAATADRADQRLRAARAEADDAERAFERARDALGAAGVALAAARDGLVPLGAPVVDGEDVLAGWTVLADWSRGQVTARERLLAEAAAEAEAARRRHEEADRALGERLATHDLPPGPGPGPGSGSGSGSRTADGASVVVADGLAGARAELARVVERRAEAARLAAEVAAAREADQIARQLGQLLRSDRFPRWMVAAALDILVEEASVTLSELSGGQFELTHEEGEFLVVDHADADSRRPVRTLSGGETFQASLALALALSSQLRAMAAGGAASLDSLFLDEGFGTLDEATLDVVASTLESLASGGGRMVGLVTHVQALAERVPVRFAVNRDQRTSTVVRERT